MSLLKKITDAASKNRTYRVGLLQTKAYRILKQMTSKSLAESSITSVEWAFLGILFDNKEGLRSADAAEMLGVEAPFVTCMVTKLLEKSLVAQMKDENDGRVKLLLISAKGSSFVEEMEKHLRKEMKPLVYGVSMGELFGYLTTLQKIVENAEKITKK